MWGSGRDALRALSGWGRRERGWRRILVPTYFCEEVVAALESELPVVRYADAPDAPPPRAIEAGPDDLVLVVNYFGARPATAVETRGVVVEDLTHDPLGQASVASRADYSMASLRKTLPLPDGAVLWSTAGRLLPPERPATNAHTRAAFERLSAMVLKLHYLLGANVDKAEYRSLFAESERAIGTGSPSGISAFSRERLRSLPAERWRRIRARNLGVFRRALGNPPGLVLMDGPFAATLLFDTDDLREQVRTRLITERIYPAVLWPRAEADAALPAAALPLSRRLLTIHGDFRYRGSDMTHVARRVAALAAEASARATHPPATHPMNDDGVNGAGMPERTR